MRALFIALLCCILITSCSNTRKDSIASLKEEVMALHDDVMPKMGELHKTQKELLSLADSVQVADSVAAKEYRDLASTIELANESMMDWMRSYDPNFVGSEEEVRKYLEDQKKSISKVKDDMLKSLEAGKKALD